jgi:hypothetical protein
MLKNFFLPQLQNKAPVRNMCFQQDSATCHTTRPVMAFLRQTFGNRLISRFCNAPCPPRSPDLTTPDFFLWGNLKEQVYKRHTHNRLELKRAIQYANEAITDDTLVAAMNNVIHRCRNYINSRGKHLESIVFKRQDIKTLQEMKKLNLSDINDPPCTKRTKESLSQRNSYKKFLLGGTQHHMLQRITELKDAVKTSIALTSKYLPVLSEDEWQNCDVTKTLKPFEEVTLN